MTTSWPRLSSRPHFSPSLWTGSHGARPNAANQPRGVRAKGAVGSAAGNARRPRWPAGGVSLRPGLRDRPAPRLNRQRQVAGGETQPRASTTSACGRPGRARLRGCRSRVPAGRPASRAGCRGLAFDRQWPLVGVETGARPRFLRPAGRRRAGASSPDRRGRDGRREWALGRGGAGLSGMMSGLSLDGAGGQAS